MGKTSRKIKNRWRKAGGGRSGLSLKAWARMHAAGGNLFAELCQRWLQNKRAA